MFTADTPTDQPRWIDYGSDFYAAVTFDDAPDNKHVMVAWMSNWSYGKKTPTSPWRGADTFPRELSLKTIDGKAELIAQPIGELEQLHNGDPSAKLSNTTMTSKSTPVDGGGQVMEIQADSEPDGRKALRDQRALPATDRSLRSDMTRRPRRSTSTARSLATSASTPPSRQFIERRWRWRAGNSNCASSSTRPPWRSSPTMGRSPSPTRSSPTPASTGMSVFADEGSAQVDSLTAWNLSSIWQN